MRRVGIVGFAHEVAHDRGGRNDAELLGPAVDRALAVSGLSGSEIGLLGTAGSEFLHGVVGTVMGAFDAIPGWPPRVHSHLEGDGALALYECWVRLLAGEADTALVCAFGRPMADDPIEVLDLQLDPYAVAPLRPGARGLAALQARVLLDSGRAGEADFARVVADRRGGPGIEQLLEEPYVASPLRLLDCSTVCSGAAAAVLAAEGTAPAGATAWITGLAHQVEPHSVGARDLAVSASTRTLATRMGLPGRGLDVLELHAPFSHQELILLDAIGAATIGRVCPSGGVLPADPLMVSGLIRIGSAAQAIMDGSAGRAVAHATNGPCLQHNLLCLLEADVTGGR